MRYLTSFNQNNIGSYCNAKAGYGLETEIGNKKKEENI